MTRIRRTALQRLRIFEAAAGLCHICGGRIDGTRERWDVEHVIPLALGGEDADHNIRPAHAACHRAKSARDAAWDAAWDAARDAQASLFRARFGGGQP